MVFTGLGNELGAHRETFEGVVIAPLVTGMPRENDESICTIVSMLLDSEIQISQDAVKESQPTIGTTLGIVVRGQDYAHRVRFWGVPVLWMPRSETTLQAHLMVCVYMMDADHSGVKAILQAYVL